jgi:hypothetical protein
MLSYRCVRNPMKDNERERRIGAALSAAFDRFLSRPDPGSRAPRVPGPGDRAQA